jgi:hypothetical protein
MQVVLILQVGGSASNSLSVVMFIKLLVYKSFLKPVLSMFTVLDAIIGFRLRGFIKYIRIYRKQHVVG